MPSILLQLAYWIYLSRSFWIFQHHRLHPQALLNMLVDPPNSLLIFSKLGLRTSPQHHYHLLKMILGSTLQDLPTFGTLSVRPGCAFVGWSDANENNEYLIGDFSNFSILIKTMRPNYRGHNQNRLDSSFPNAVNFELLIHQVLKSTAPSSRRLIVTSFAYLLCKKGISESIIDLMLNDLNTVSCLIFFLINFFFKLKFYCLSLFKEVPSSFEIPNYSTSILNTSICLINLPNPPHSTPLDIVAMYRMGKIDEPPDSIGQQFNIINNDPSKKQKNVPSDSETESQNTPIASKNKGKKTSKNPPTCSQSTLEPGSSQVINLTQDSDEENTK
ncbi:hypothetical protein VP01_3229g2, partial [Puccinia sorghi]